ncbi:MAG: DUF2194 domain-containing protein [Chloroflexota bacterium]
MKITKRKLILAALALFTLPWLAVHGAPEARAATSSGIPISAAILIDRENTLTDRRSDLYLSMEKILGVNKIPFDSLDISEIAYGTFLNDASVSRYSVLLLMTPGFRINETSSRLITSAVSKGMGVVSLLPDAVNTELMPVFGIENMEGDTWLTSQNLRILQDKFTIAYNGQTIDGEFMYQEHRLLPDTGLIATCDDPDQAAIWTYQYGAGKAVFHNNNATWTKKYQGLIRQSILYAMPVGVACPVNAGCIMVDDCPVSFYTDQSVVDEYDNYYLNFRNWLQAYHLTATFFPALSYSGEIDDFWVHPESLECARDIVTSGDELGLHCGNKHTPLSIDSWDSKAALDAEVKEMMKATSQLRARLYENYGTALAPIVSYMAPGNEIDDDGYQALDQETMVRYVGTLYFGNDDTLQKDFGREGSTNIFNLPPVDGEGFYAFGQSRDSNTTSRWNNLRSVIESGDSYLIFTNAYEADLKDGNPSPDAPISKLFDGYQAWGDYVSQHYPFYHWWTAGELGRYLENRQGTLEAAWFPENNTLRIKPPQPDDVIHIKTDKYLAGISINETDITLKFDDERDHPVSSAQYDLLTLDGNYFLSLRDSRQSGAMAPETPFTFKPVTMPVRPGNVMTGGKLSLPTEAKSLVALLSITAAGMFFLAGTLIVHRLNR